MSHESGHLTFGMLIPNTDPSSYSYFILPPQRKYPCNNVAIPRSPGRAHLHPTQNEVGYRPFGYSHFLTSISRISYSVLMMHRRKDLWGPDGTSADISHLSHFDIFPQADEFDPDRFLDHRLQKYLLNNAFIFLPFNAGPRICLGQQVRPRVFRCFKVKVTHESSLSSLPTTRCPS